MGWGRWHELHGAALLFRVRARLLLWGGVSFPSSFRFPFGTSLFVSSSPQPPFCMFPDPWFFSRLVSCVAFAVDALGFGVLVDLAPASELRVGFSVGYVCWLDTLGLDVFGLCVA